MTPPLMFSSSATLHSALQVIVISQLASAEALPSTAACSQPALLPVNAASPHSYGLATSVGSYSPLLGPGCVCFLILCVCLLFTGLSSVFLSSDSASERRTMNEQLRGFSGDVCLAEMDVKKAKGDCMQRTEGGRAQTLPEDKEKSRGIGLLED